MKKINVLSISALIVGLFFVSSCGNKKSAKNVSLKTDVDSVSYAIGVQNGDQMLTYFPEQGRLEVEHMDEFVEGFLDAVYSEESKSKNYEFGKQIGAEMKTSLKDTPLLPNDSTKKINKDAFIDGLVETLLKKESVKMTKEEATLFSQAFFQKAQEAANAPAIEAENKFLAENKTKEGVIETESGLQYKIITQGKGAIPGENMNVKVNYTGTLIDGTKFDSSADHGNGEPFMFNTSGGVIPAWIEIAKIMPVGSKYIVYAPSKLAYGSRDMGKIPAYSTLIFEIELLEIVK